MSLPWKLWCLYLALLLSLGLVVAYALSAWLLGGEPDIEGTDTQHAAMAYSAMLTPCVVALVAGWRSWNAMAYLAAAAVTGGLLANDPAMALFSLLLSSAVYAGVRGLHHFLLHGRRHGSSAGSGFTVTGETTDEAEDPPTHHEHDSASEYIDAGIYPVVEAKKLLRRMEEAGLDFHIETPHMDPTGGDMYAAAHGGSFGMAHQTFLFVHRKDIEAFDAIQSEMHRQETEAGDDHSLLQTFRSWAVNHDLEYTHEDDDPDYRPKD